MKLTVKDLEAMRMPPPRGRYDYEEVRGYNRAIDAVIARIKPKRKPKLDIVERLSLRFQEEKCNLPAIVESPYTGLWSVSKLFTGMMIIIAIIVFSIRNITS